MYRSPCVMKSLNRLALTELRLHVDVKAEGGMVVVPPSVTGGRQRRFLRGLDHIKMLPADSEVVSKLRTTGRGGGLGILVKRPARRDSFHAREYPCARFLSNYKAPRGERNDVLFSLYCALLASDNTPEHAQHIVELTNEQFPEPMSPADVAKCTRKKYRFSCSTMRQRVPQVEKVCASCHVANDTSRVRTALHPVLLRRLVTNKAMPATAAALVLVITGQAIGAGDAARSLGVSESGIHKYFRKLRLEGLGNFLARDSQQGRP